jgi:hypothetical protein
MSTEQNIRKYRFQIAIAGIGHHQAQFGALILNDDTKGRSDAWAW